MIIQVGQAIGALWTILLLIVDSIIGARLLRWQGARAWRELPGGAGRGPDAAPRDPRRGHDHRRRRVPADARLRHRHLRAAAADPAHAGGRAPGRRALDPRRGARARVVVTAPSRSRPVPDRRPARPDAADPRPRPHPAGRSCRPDDRPGARGRAARTRAPGFLDSVSVDFCARRARAVRARAHRARCPSAGTRTRRARSCSPARTWC